MADQESPTPSRVSAAKAVLELSLKGCELDDLAERVSAMEEVIHESP
jgi:hypothetical protein